jgi:LysM repeat protein
MHSWWKGFLIVLGVVVVMVAAPRVTRADDTVYIVQPGDTLSEIAQQYGTDVATLRRLNGLSDIDFVWSGQRLILPENAENVADNPADSRVEPSVPPSDTSSIPSSEEKVTYVVRAGDSLLSIAADFQTSLAQLAELNSVYPGQQLVVGRDLLVPRLMHVVQAGEHLGTIAALHDTTPTAIARANALADPSLIVPGQRLTIVPPSQAERMGLESESTTGTYHTHTEFPTEIEKWIDVDLSEQRVVAYEGKTPVRSFIVSTGLPGTPTVTGTFRIWAKTPIQDMYGGNRAAGTYYYLEDVQWVQYFYEDYSFHGTYWHNNFGRPMSRGCVNMTNEDAEWLFEWASPTHTEQGWYISEGDEDTLVVVHQ